MHAADIRNMLRQGFPRAGAGRPAFLQLVWVAAAATLGFAVAALFAGALKLPRALYLVPYISSIGLFLAAYFHWSGVDLVAALRRHPAWSAVVAVAASALVATTVWRQPPSPVPQGLPLVADLLWLGLVYGLADALLLSVLPAVAVWRFCAQQGWTQRPLGRLAAGAAGWVASVLVTVADHLGYPEFRGPQVLGPVIGNGLITLSYLLTMNPLVAAVVHIAMHVAAVLHGIDTTIQLPPH